MYRQCWRLFVLVACFYLFFFFFFQAEDGIRDRNVTGVQTCALPIFPLSELWGMSETTGAGTCNPPEKIKIGTVGIVAPGIEIKLAEDGEVLIKGPVVMPGYRNQPEKTKETFTDDGFLMTGDIGEFDDEGYLKIVDRKKELIISAAGKNMSPANIEAAIKTALPLIGQACCIGERRPY